MSNEEVESIETPESPEEFRSPEVMLITGMTYRQLDYCISSGLVTPSVEAGVGSGSRRVFSAADVALLRVVTALRTMGVRGKVMRVALDLISTSRTEGLLVLPSESEPYMTRDPRDIATHDACCVVNVSILYSIDS